MFEIVNQLLTSFAWFALCMIVFSVLAMLMPLHQRQPLWRKDAPLDTIYWFFPALLYAPVSMLLVSGGLYLMHGGDESRIDAFIQQGYPPIATQPLWLQFILLLFVSDLIQYWIHRIFHRSTFWRFHAIHHSPKELDWMVAARFHPVNFIVSSSFVGTLMILLGFSPILFAMMVPFNYLYSGLVHANVNWNFGPLRYVFASPVFHHWHHTMSDQGGNKNFAATLAIYDVIFGTFYMPADRLPEQYGVDSDDVPADLVGQFFYPFLEPNSARGLAEFSPSAREAETEQSVASSYAAVVGQAAPSSGSFGFNTEETVIEHSSAGPSAEAALSEQRPTGLPASVFTASDEESDLSLRPSSTTGANVQPVDSGQR